jgi:DNA transformation protein and related proteins
VPVTASYLTYVIDQLGGTRVATTRRMFGCVGLYQAELFFGVIDDDVVFLRVDDASRPAYVERGMRPLRPLKSKPDIAMENYYQLPDEVLEDSDELGDWVRQALAAAAAAPRKGKARKSKRRG